MNNQEIFNNKNILVVGGAGFVGSNLIKRILNSSASTSITIIDKILDSGGIVSAYDPKAMTEIKKIFGKKIQYGKEMYQICKGADALILITEWPEFREPDFNKMKKLLKNPIIFDGRNIYNPSLLKKKGFSYFGIGK